MAFKNIGMYFFSGILSISRAKLHYLLNFFFSTFIYFWDRERQSMNGGGAEREGDTESEAGSRLSCQHRALRGAHTHRPWDHDLSWSWKPNRLSHPGTPNLQLLLAIYVSLVSFHGLCSKQLQEWRSRDHARCFHPGFSVLDTFSGQCSTLKKVAGWRDDVLDWGRD